MLKTRYTFITYLLLSFCLCVGFSASGQNAKLAQEYMRNGEYEKASYLYKALSEKNKKSTYYLENYIECLELLGQIDEGIDYLQREMKTRSADPMLNIQLGKLYAAKLDEPNTNKYYKKAVDLIKTTPQNLSRAANVFYRLGKYQYAVDIYEIGRANSEDPLQYAYQLGNLYYKLDKTPEMISEYLNALQTHPTYRDRIQTHFTQALDSAGLDELELQLYTTVQDYPEENIYPDMLQWLYITRKDYKNAFRQAKAIDLRQEEQGQRIFNVAQTAANDRAFDAAIEGYRYIVSEKGPSSSMYVEAQRELLRTQRLKITTQADYSKADLASLESDYESFIQNAAQKFKIASIILQYARLQVYYLDNLDKGISLLDDLIKTRNVNKYIRANSKLELADFYLIRGEVWEASLLNSQVDKEFGEDLLGHEARYRNAMLSYFNQDFEWAQTQFKVLKASTSKLIANDALERDVFITDNLGLDTTDHAISLYARAELNLIQHKYDAAQTDLDSIKANYPDHGLLDDVAYLEAQQAVARKQYYVAIQRYQFIIDNHIEDIRGDNALYELATLYEDQLGEIEKALPLYEKIIVDHPDSVFISDARKRYRSQKSTSEITKEGIEP